MPSTRYTVVENTVRYRDISATKPMSSPLLFEFRRWTTHARAKEVPSDDLAFQAAKNCLKNCANMFAKSFGKSCSTMNRPEMFSTKFCKYLQHATGPSFSGGCEVFHGFIFRLCSFRIWKFNHFRSPPTRAMFRAFPIFDKKVDGWNSVLVIKTKQPDLAT